MKLIMKAKDLRNSILQLAVQGKLVPQDQLSPSLAAKHGVLRNTN